MTTPFGWSINVIGLLSAAAVTGMLAGLMVWFNRIYRHSHYRRWGWSWAATSCYSLFSAVSVGLYGVVAPDHPARLALSLAAQVSGYCGVVLLVAGTVELTRRTVVSRGLLARWLLLAATSGVFSTVIFLADPSQGWTRFLFRVGVKAAAVAVGYVLSATMLWRMRAAGFAIGHRLLAGAFLVYGTVQLNYLIYGLAEAFGFEPGYQIAYVSFLDVAVLTAIAIASVATALEDERVRAEASDRAAREAVAALDRQGARFGAMIEQSNDVITILDPDGVVRYESPSMTRILGYGVEECLGKSAFDYIHPDDLEGAFLALQEGVQRDRPITHRYRFRHKDGHYVHLESIGRIVTEQLGGPVMVINSRDVTDRVRLERQLLEAQKMESVGRLAGGVAHDFNNMLTIIKGNAEIGRTVGNRGGNPVREFDEIAEAADRAAQLTRQLLAFARRQVVAPVVADANELVVRTSKMVERLIGETIELDTVLTEAPALVRVDPGQLEQVLVNLVVNARDAMPNGGRLRLAVGRSEVRDEALGPEDVPPGAYVTIMVADTGVGLTPEIRAHLFEPFFTTKPTGQGTGLGLATSYGIVRQAEGFITAESEAGKGAVFTIFLPESRAEQAPRLSPAGQRRIVGVEGILVVEDDPVVRSVAVTTLRGLGYRVFEAADGEQGLAQARRHTGAIQLVVTDVVMPRMGGPGMVEHLRREGVVLPVIFTSGYADDSAVLGALPGRSVYLRKPYSPTELAESIRRLLDVGVAV